MLEILKRWTSRYFASEEVLVLVLMLAFFLAAMFFIGDVLIPIFIAITIAFILQGGVQRLMNIGVPKFAAVCLIEILFITTLLLIAMILLPSLWGQLKNFINELPNIMARIQTSVNVYVQDYPQWISIAQVEEVNAAIKDKIAKSATKILSFSFSNLTNLFTIAIYCFLIPVLVFFFLKDKDQLLTWVASFLPEKRPFISRISSEMNSQIAKYIRGKAIEIFIVGVACFILLSLLDVRYSVLLSVLTGLSVLVPYFGAGAIGILVTVIAFVQFGISANFLYVFFGYGVLQIVDGNLLVPVLFSEAVNLHPVAILVAVLIFGGLWGFWGLFFAIPLATLVNALIKSWPRQINSEEV